MAKEVKIILDSKSLTAIGFTVVGVILAVKMNPEQAKEASIHLFDAFKVFGPALTQNC